MIKTNFRGSALLFKVALLPLCISLISGCGSSTSTDDSTSDDSSDTSGSTNSGNTTLGSTQSSTSTIGVGCDYNYSGFNSSTSVDADSQSSWACSDTERTVTGNGIPDHEVGTFPNAGNPNTIAAITVDTSYTTSPTLAAMSTEMGGPSGPQGYVLNGVKIDASTAGSCVDNASSTETSANTSDCSLIENGNGWGIEALGQSSFNFGTDDNNAHVQPGGAYHYHGMPEGFITLRGGDNTKMTMIGWAADGFPIYARYGYSDANDATSAIRAMTGSWQNITNVSADRADVAIIPLGTFRQDWTYVEGSGDLDECNGRTGVTPEFPNGIYHYYATDTYPYFQRCVSGTVATTGGPGGPGGPPQQ